MKWLLAILLSAMTATAADVQFPLRKFTSANTTNRMVQITPTDLTPPAGIVPNYDAITFRTDAAGQFTVSNMYGGIYQVCILAPASGSGAQPEANCFTINVPTNSGLVTADTILVVSTNATSPSGKYAYSQAAADAKLNSASNSILAQVTNTTGAYVPLAGGTLSGPLTNLTADARGSKAFNVLVGTASNSFVTRSGYMRITNNDVPGTWWDFNNGLKIGSGNTTIVDIDTTPGGSYQGGIHGNPIGDGSALSNVTASTASAVSAGVSNAFVLGNGGGGTNNSFFDAMFKDQYSPYSRAFMTNSAPAMSGNGVMLVFINDYPTNRTGIFFYDRSTGYKWTYRWTSDHGGVSGAKPEMAEYGDGKMAIGWSLIGPLGVDRDLQLGVQMNQRPFVALMPEIYNDLGASSVDGVPWYRRGTMSAPLLMQATYTKADGTIVAVPANRTTSAKMGGTISYEPSDSTGTGRLVGWAVFDAALDSSHGNTNDWNLYNSERAWEATTTTTNNAIGGVKDQTFRTTGGLIYDRSTSYSPSDTNYALNFASKQVMDISAIGTAANFYTTNATGAATNSEWRLFRLRANGFTVALTYPLWSTNGAGLPASITGSDILELRLRSDGTGETNKTVETVQIVKDQTFAYDADLLVLLNKVGGTTPAMSNNLNSFFRTVKSDTTWSNIYGAGGLFGLCFSNAASNAFNFVATGPNLTYSGTPVSNNQTGIVGSAAGTFYVNTRFRTTNQNAGTLYSYIVSDGGTSQFLCGSGGGNKNNFIRHISSSSWAGLINDPNANTPAQVAAVAFPCGVMITRTSSTSETLYAGANTQTASSNTSVSPATWDSYWFALNNAGSADGSSPTGYWDGQVQGIVYTTNTLTAGNFSTLNTAFGNLKTAMGR